MYQVIARKYRPQDFAELIGQEHVRTTLANAINQRRIAHGYILSGQRGTGKTTVARILARCLNCAKGPATSPCGECSSCLEIAASSAIDVIEIDAASNRGINEMRELRESVRFRPARDRYKVFIIDEAHQITNEAFNALLKTLEEPPEWVVFILCTTEAHKIPVTIASRCQQFSFRSVDFPDLVERMKWICAEEKIEADDETLGVLAQAGEGSVRDSLSALDQAIACCGSKLDATEVRRLLGMFSIESLHEVTAALAASDSRKMLEIVAELERNGRHLHHFCRELARYFRNLLVVRITGTDTRLIGASPQAQDKLAAIATGFSEDDLTRYLHLTLDLFSDMQQSLQPRLHLELGLLRLVHAGRLTSIEEALASLQSQGGGGEKAPPAPKPNPPAAPPPPRTAAPQAKPAGDLRSQLRAHLINAGMTFTADGIEHSEVNETDGQIMIVAPEEFRLAMKESDLQKAAQAVLGRAVRVKIAFGNPAAPPIDPQQAAEADDEAAGRAMGNPEVKRFQELFPGSQVRVVRNLKE